MNTITGTTSVNTVADNIGSAVVDNSDYTSDQVFYNFEKFDFILQLSIGYLVYSGKLLCNCLNILLFMIPFKIVYARFRYNQ